MSNPIIDRLGTERWFHKGQLHRENGPAIKHTNGSKAWYVNGVRHRENGPAIEAANGNKVWFINGGLHREDGPAIERADPKMRKVRIDDKLGTHGDSTLMRCEWWIDNKRVEDFCHEHNIPYIYKDWPTEYKILWKLR